MTIFNHITAKPITRQGRTIPGYDDGADYNAIVEPGKFIRIYGKFPNAAGGPRSFDLAFQIGDEAEYDSANTSFIGTITAISEKTVTIKHDRWNAETSRLSLHEFVRRNWDGIAHKRQRDAGYLD